MNRWLALAVIGLVIGVKTGRAQAPPSPIQPAAATERPSQVPPLLPETLDARRDPFPLPDMEKILPDNREKLQTLYDRALQRFASIHTYIVRFKRRETIGQRALPEDNLLMKFRKEPFSIYLKSLEGSPTSGREMIYVRGQFNNQLQIKAGKYDIMPGMRLEMDLNSPRATMNSRRTLDEAGFGNMIARFGIALAEMDSGTRPPNSLRYLGPQSRPETRQRLEGAAQVVPPGFEKHLPHGGRRYWFFSAEPTAAEYGLPMLIITLDETGREVEYYFSDRLCVNVNLGDRDFDPDYLWGK
jgi:hypothetical protein